MRKEIIAVIALVVTAPLLAMASASPIVESSSYPCYRGCDPPYREPNYDWPAMLAFKGLAANGEKMAPVAVIALADASTDPYSFDLNKYQLYIVVNGEAKQLAVESAESHPELGAYIVRFKEGSLTIKAYTINYQQTLFVSGKYGDWQLNMRLADMNSDVIYRIMQPLPKDTPVPEPMPMPLPVVDTDV